MDELWLKETSKEDPGITFPTDELTLMKLRREVDQQGSWGWFIWSDKDIPLDREKKELPAVRPPKLSKRQNGKDVIYQKWRSKYNNDNLMSTEDWKEKRSRTKHNPTTARRVTATVRNLDTGYTVNSFGTLVGISDKKSITQEMKQDQKRLIESMKSKSHASREYVQTLERLWEVQYAYYNGMSQEELRQRFEVDNLTIVKHYLYFETYARKICQLEKTIADTLYLSLCEIASVIKDIFAMEGRQKESYFIKEERALYQEVPVISVLMQISAYFRECPRIFMQLHQFDVRQRSEIMDEVSRNGTCDVIFELTSIRSANRFGVACQGVPFIMELTEKEAVFVFATSPDVFGFNPDRQRNKKADRINSLIEFLRRSVLGIRDTTKLEEMKDIHK
jgi:hypothetical protein